MTGLNKKAIAYTIATCQQPVGTSGFFIWLFSLQTLLIKEAMDVLKLLNTILNSSNAFNNVVVVQEAYIERKRLQHYVQPAHERNKIAF